MVAAQTSKKERFGEGRGRGVRVAGTEAARSGCTERRFSSRQIYAGMATGMANDLQGDVGGMAT